MRIFFLPLILSLLIVPRALADDAKADNSLSEQEAAEGFINLVDGGPLDEHWMGSTKGYVVEDGVLVCQEDGGGTLLTKKTYDNFVLRFDFKLPPGGNNGVALRTPPKGNPAYAGIECQIIDNTAPKYKDLRPNQLHGSLYGLVPAKTGFLKPLGEWNSEEIVCDGRHVKVTLNGTVIVDADLSKIDGKGWRGKGWRRDSGHIGFMGHGSRVEFRNVRIREL